MTLSRYAAENHLQIHSEAKLEKAQIHEISSLLYMQMLQEIELFQARLFGGVS